MKANQFKEVIRKIISEEVKKEVSNQLPKLLFEMLGHKPKSVVHEQSIPKNLSHSLQKIQTVKNKEDDPEELPTPQPKVIKRYTKNPILNQILNETTPGLPQTPYADTGVPLPSFDKIGGISEEFVGEMKQILNEESNTEHSSDEINKTEQVDLNKLFNKNFKAILDKSKNGHGGGFNKMLQTW